MSNERRLQGKWGQFHGKTHPRSARVLVEAVSQDTAEGIFRDETRPKRDRVTGEPVPPKRASGARGLERTKA